MELAGELQSGFGSAAYIRQYGGGGNVGGSAWQVTEAAVASDVPEVAALKDYLKNLERTYLQHRAKIEQVVARDSGKVKDIRKKLEKIKKYVDDMLSSL